MEIPSISLRLGPMSKAQNDLDDRTANSLSKLSIPTRVTHSHLKVFFFSLPLRARKFVDGKDKRGG